MKIKELIKILGNYDLESDVLLEISGDGCYNLCVCEDEDIYTEDLYLCIDNSYEEF